MVINIQNRFLFQGRQTNFPESASHPAIVGFKYRDTFQCKLSLSSSLYLLSAMLTISLLLFKSLAKHSTYYAVLESDNQVLVFVCFVKEKPATFRCFNIDTNLHLPAKLLSYTLNTVFLKGIERPKLNLNLPSLSIVE